VIAQTRARRSLLPPPRLALSTRAYGMCASSWATFTAADVALINAEVVQTRR
jgi:hypothetical protein